MQEQLLWAWHFAPMLLLLFVRGMSGACLFMSFFKLWACLLRCTMNISDFHGCSGLYLLIEVCMITTRLVDLLVSIIEKPAWYSYVLGDGVLFLGCGLKWSGFFSCENISAGSQKISPESQIPCQAFCIYGDILKIYNAFRFWWVCWNKVILNLSALK